MTEALHYSREDIERIKKQVDLVAIVGAKIKLHRQGREWKGLCPFHFEGTPSFYVIPQRRICHCFGCMTTVDVFEFIQRTEGLTFVEAIQKVEGDPVVAKRRFTSASQAAEKIKQSAHDARARIDKARAIWEEAQPAQRTLVETYLRSRRLTNIIIPPAIRFHGSLYHAETKGHLPAMVAVVLDNERRIVGIHRTYLRVDGRGKAGTGSDKKMLGACQGAHVWLSEPGGGTLAIAEGIETALSVRQLRPGMAVWAALSLGNMGAQVPETVRDVLLCADNDSKDPAIAQHQMDQAVRRLTKPGRPVRVTWAERGKDFNDMLKA